RIDLDVIIDSAEKWGWIEGQGQWALDIVVHNACKLVAGTQQEKQLLAISQQLGVDAEVVRQQYRAALVDELKDHTSRGFAPWVGGKVLSLPLAKILLPLQAIEGRPALAEYAEEDLRRQGTDDLQAMFNWQRQQADLERRSAQLKAKQAAQRPLSLAGLL